MKSIILIALALVAITAAAPAVQAPVEILSYGSELNPDGSYNFYYESADGSSRKEEGLLKEALDEENKPQKVIVISGTYTYLDSEGNPDTITYFADESGYHAEGKSIPKVVSRR